MKLRFVAYVSAYCLYTRVHVCRLVYASVRFWNAVTINRCLHTKSCARSRARHADVIHRTCGKLFLPGCDLRAAYMLFRWQTHKTCVTRPACALTGYQEQLVDFLCVYKQKRLWYHRVIFSTAHVDVALFILQIMFWTSSMRQSGFSTRLVKSIQQRPRRSRFTQQLKILILCIEFILVEFSEHESVKIIEKNV